MTLFQNKYRIEPARLPDYDYSTPGWYFITICTKNRVQYFGDIVSVETPDSGVSNTTETPGSGVSKIAIENQTSGSGVSKTPTSQSQIQLSEIGQIADKYWNEIHSHFPHVILDAYQIMPDHIHGIIQITAVETPDPGVSKTTNENQTPDPGVSNTTIENQTPDPVSITENRIETPDSGVSTPATETPNSGVSTRPTLGIIINQFKRICTIKIRNANLKFAWQPRFHDHIIRDDEELQRIREYIRDNPQNWMNEKL
jgi:putative transposase